MANCRGIHHPDTIGQNMRSYRENPTFATIVRPTANADINNWQDFWNPTVKRDDQ